MEMRDESAFCGAPPRLSNQPPIMEVTGLNLWYGDVQALRDINLALYPCEILAFIGPSGCGKSTALKCLNRMHDGLRGVRIEGTITMHGQDIMSPEIDPPLHRRRFGWVAQKPNPFPSTIYENVAYPARIHGLCKSRADLDAHVETCLRKAMLWDETRDVLHSAHGTDLSGGQQQRLCVARALSLKPDVLLMDEPTGSIDPIATAKIEDLMLELRHELSVVVITHSMMEARRIADRVAMFHLGELIEIGPTQSVFDAPRDARTADFVHGCYG